MSNEEVKVEEQVEVKQEVEAKVEAPSDEIQSLVKHEVSLEDQARAQGWRPKEEWQGDPNEWKDAKHFIENGQNWKKQAALARELKELRDNYRSLVESQANIQKIEYERAYNDILQTKARIAASPNPNFQDYDKLKEQELALKQKMEAQAGHQEDPRLLAIKNSGAFAKFSLLNPWYGKTDSDSQYLQMKAAEISAGMPIPETEEEIDRVLTAVHNKMNKEYGHLIHKNQPNRSAKVMPVTYNTGSPSNDSFDHLGVAEQGAIAYLKSRPGTPEQIKKSVEDYLKSLKK